VLLNKQINKKYVYIFQMLLTGQRVSLAVMLILCMVVVMVTTALGIAPPIHETVPMLIIYYVLVLLHIVIMLFVVSYTLKLHLKRPRGGEHISLFMRRWIYDFLAVKFGCRPRDTISTNQGSGARYWSQEREALVNDDQMMELSEGVKQDEGVSRALNSMAKKMEMEDAEKQAKIEFQVCAHALDRFALIIFTVTFVLFTVIYLVKTV